MVGEHVRLQQQILLDLANHIQGKCHFSDSPPSYALLFINVTENYRENKRSGGRIDLSRKHG
jgi:hypothetical protein